MKKYLKAAMLATVLSSGAGAVYGNPANRQSSARGLGSVRWQ